MFDLTDFLESANVTIRTVICEITDRRTGEKVSATFYYPEISHKSFEDLGKLGYGYDVVANGKSISGKIDLAEMFDVFTDFEEREQK